MKERIAKYISALAKAEEAIKYAEYSIDAIASGENENCQPVKQVSGVVVPAINELRYSAKHFSDAVAGDDVGEMEKAYQHCVRAKYDALRGVAIYLISDFRQFLDDYRLVDSFAEHFTDFNAACDLVEETKIRLSQEIGIVADEEKTAWLKEKVEALSRLYLRTKGCRGPLNRLLAQMERHDAATYKQWLIALTVSLFTFFLGLVIASYPQWALRIGVPLVVFIGGVAVGQLKIIGNIWRRTRAFFGDRIGGVHL